MENHERLPEALRTDWERQQRELAARVVATDDADWIAGDSRQLAGLHTVAGLDISFPPGHEAASAGGSGSGGAPHAPPGAVPATAAASHAYSTSETAGTIATAVTTKAAACPVAALAVLDFPALSLRHLELLPLAGEHALQAPYAPGFLGFREVSAFLELLRRAAAKGVHPQLLLVDGFGVLHPRRCGAASHLGVLSGLPTVGVAKHLLHLEGLLPERQVRAAAAAALEESQLQPSLADAHSGACDAQEPAAMANSSSSGSSSGWRLLARSGTGWSSSSSPDGRSGGEPLWLPLATDSGEVLGMALCCPQGTGPAGGSGCRAGDGDGSCTGGSGGRGGSSSSRAGFRRPIYVSAGHRVGLATALVVVARCCRHRVPEPIRQADLLSRAEVRRQLQQGSAKPQLRPAAPP